MIALPLIAGAPAALSMPASDALAARCALAIAPPGPLAPIRKRGGLIEQWALIREANAWLARATADLQIIRPALHFTLGAVVNCDCTLGAAEPITVWMGNAPLRPWASRWALERRWKALEREAPGLAPTALTILHDGQFAAAAPLYTPSQALGLAHYAYWMGESDETEVLAQYMDGEEEAAQEVGETINGLTKEQLCDRFGIPTRAFIDRTLPPAVSSPKRALNRAALERLARRPGAAGKLAAAALALASGAKRRRNSKDFALHTEQDDHWAIGAAATIRWSARDPMARIFDDHAHRLSEDSSAVEDFWGWFVLKRAEDLPRLTRQLERQFGLMRAMEQLIPLIADRSYE